MVDAKDKAQVSRNRKIGLSLAAFIFAADQLVKWVVVELLQLQQREEIGLLPFFKLRWVENRGVSMGLLTADSDTARWGLVIMTSAIATFVTFWMWREKRREDALALSLVLGGALGNIVDRVRFGYVIDYADLHFGDISPFLVFNVADAAITIGVLLLLVRALLTRDKAPAREESEHA